jgi:hypothetical protein
MLHFPCLAGAPLIRTTRAGIIIQPEPALPLSQDADVNARARDRPKPSDQLKLRFGRQVTGSVLARICRSPVRLEGASTWHIETTQGSPELNVGSYLPLCGEILNNADSREKAEMVIDSYICKNCDH